MQALLCVFRAYVVHGQREEHASCDRSSDQTQRKIAQVNFDVFQQFTRVFHEFAVCGVAIQDFARGRSGVMMLSFICSSRNKNEKEDHQTVATSTVRLSYHRRQGISLHSRQA
jgi:hypothetical protein